MSDINLAELLASLADQPDAALNGAPVVVASVETISPAIAKKLLAGNVVNRPLRKARVDLYAKYMANNQWRVTGESIVLSPTGQLLQGQHRLSACIQADAPFTTVVVRGVEPTAMGVMDTGLARTASDMFSMAGIHNTAGQAAMVRQLIGIKGGFATNTSRMSLITRDELMTFYNEHSEELGAAWTLARETGIALRYSRAAWASLAFLVMEADADMASEFFAGLGSGVGLAAGDPRLALRGYFLNATAQRRGIEFPEQVAMGIKTWNSWLSGHQTTHVKGWKPVHPWPKVES